MTPQLQRSLESGAAPFDGFCLHDRESLSLGQLQTVLEMAFSRLQSLEQRVFAFADWHEHDGFVLESQETTWHTILADIRDIQSLFASRIGDDFVRNAFHGLNHQWLLRYHIGDDANQEDDCFFDLSATPGSPYEQVANDLLKQFPAWLTRSPARSWFLARGC